MAPLRIAFFVNWFPVVSETFIQTAALGLLADGHEVDVYALRGHTPTPNPTLPQWDSAAGNVHTVTVDTSSASWRTLPNAVS
jgi:hypothetical protein